MGHLGDVGLRPIALVRAHELDVQRHGVVALENRQVGALLAAQVRRPAPALARVDDDVVAAKQVPDHDLVRRRQGLIGRDRRASELIVERNDADVRAERLIDGIGVTPRWYPKNESPPKRFKAGVARASRTVRLGAGPAGAWTASIVDGAGGHGARRSRSPAARLGNVGRVHLVDGNLLVQVGQRWRVDLGRHVVEDLVERRRGPTLASRSLRISGAMLSAGWCAQVILEHDPAVDDDVGLRRAQLGNVDRARASASAIGVSHAGSSVAPATVSAVMPYCSSAPPARRTARWSGSRRQAPIELVLHGGQIADRRQAVLVGRLLADHERVRVDRRRVVERGQVLRAGELA